MLLSILEPDVELVTIQIASSEEFSPLKTCHQVKTGLQFREKKRKKSLISRDYFTNAESRECKNRHST
jgi:hypothetical protein